MTTHPADWNSPGAFPVAHGVHRVPLPLPNDGLRAVNVYVIELPTGVVLVDGGWSIPVSWSALEAALAGLSLSPADIRRILVTHVHRDHYSQAVAVRRRFGSRVALGVAERPNLEALQDRCSNPVIGQAAQLAMLGADCLARAILARKDADPLDPVDWTSPDEWLVPGPIDLGAGRTLVAVATPGHTAGHTVFHDEDARLLFAGDHVLPSITPAIGFEPVLSDDPLSAFLESLAALRARPDAALLPAHGPPAPSVHARVDELVAHHGRRIDDAERAIDNGANTAFEAAGELRWTRREHRLRDLDAFNAMLAVIETAAHLDLLTTQGRLVRVIHDGVRHYRPS